VIAALNGHCVGGGPRDRHGRRPALRAQGAGKIGLPEVNLGVLPGTGGTQRLTRWSARRARSSSWPRAALRVRGGARSGS
jgi:enoyl-CoA hydratase/carnithine racemase